MASAVPAVLLLLAPALAGADDARPVSPSAFRDLAEGYTLHFEHDGAYFGSEAFREGGRSTWRYPDGTCIDGTWEPHGAQLCFTYEGRGRQLCWRMLEDEDGYFALLLGDEPDAGLELRLVGRDRAPLLCGGVGA